MKIIGAFIIIAVFSITGFYFSYKTSYRKNDLRDFKTAILIIKSEIDYMNNSIGAASEAAAERVEKPIKDFFTLFGERLRKKSGERADEIWREVIEENIGGTYLEDEDKSVIISMGRIFGYSDDEMQKSSIDMAIEYIDEKCGELETAGQKNRKMYQSIGILSGIMVVILLL